MSLVRAQVTRDTDEAASTGENTLFCGKVCENRGIGTGLYINEE
jgi:hypothetical protein